MELTVLLRQVLLVLVIMAKKTMTSLGQETVIQIVMNLKETATKSIDFLALQEDLLNVGLRDARVMHVVVNQSACWVSVVSIKVKKSPNSPIKAVATKRGEVRAGSAYACLRTYRGLVGWDSIA